MDAIRKIKQIGTSGICSDEDFVEFLPHFPIIHGNEFIFTIGWANASEYIDEEVENFIKGLHIIEEKYKQKEKNDFGFGSPSPTAMVIDREVPKSLPSLVGEWTVPNFEREKKKYQAINGPPRQYQNLVKGPHRPPTSPGGGHSLPNPHLEHTS